MITPQTPFIDQAHPFPGCTHTYDKLEAIKSEDFTAEHCLSALFHDDETDYLGKTARKAIEAKLRKLEKAAPSAPRRIVITLTESSLYSNEITATLVFHPGFKKDDKSTLAHAAMVAMNSIAKMSDE